MSDIKIRTLPRKDEGRRPDDAPPSKRPRLPKTSYWQIASVATIVLVLLGYVMLPDAAPPARELSSQQPLRDPMVKRLSGYVDEVRFKEEALRQRRELENMRLRASGQALDLEASAPEVPRPLGVTMDSENVADRLYGQLNDRPTLNVDSLPESRINARLEKNKWVNELDRQERVQFIRNFIKSAYDRGYEVQLDQNLVVVGVRPIQNRTVSLDQAIDRVTKQGL